MSKAVFMGRNGTITTMPKGLLNPYTCRMTEGSIPALNRLGMGGYILNVVSNEKGEQPGMDYVAIIHQIEKWIRGQTFSPIFFQYCYHHHAKKCTCRLPKIGLIEALRAEHDIDMSESIMFASSKQEIIAAQTAKIGNIVRIKTGKADWNGDYEDLPLHDTLLDAVLGMGL